LPPDEGWSYNRKRKTGGGRMSLFKAFVFGLLCLLKIINTPYDWLILFLIWIEPFKSEHWIWNWDSKEDKK
jgi:hypothetical protein